MHHASAVRAHRDLPPKADVSSQTEVRIVDPILEPDWDRLVLSHSGFNFFHRTAWAKVLCRTYGHKPTYLYFTQRNQPLALLPVMEVASPVIGCRGISLPFSDFCDPLVFGELRHELFVAKLLTLGRERNWRYFEVRGGRESLPASAVSAERYFGHKLDLSVGVDKLFANLQSSARRAIRKAEKHGLTVEISSARKALLDFYRLHVRTRRRHGLPPQPLPFFLNVDEEIMGAGLGFVVLVKIRTTPIAAAVFFYSGEAALFKFGASDERSHEFRGNNLVMWEGIKHLCEIGLKTLHFGRTAMDNEGLRRFKLSWGAEEEVIEYFRFALNAQTWLSNSRSASEFHHQLFRRLPLAANRIAGALIYPHLD